MNLKARLAAHVAWLADPNEGERFDARGENLAKVELRSANLRQANLAGVNLTEAYLRNTDFTQANLESALLGGCSAHHACFRDADLSSVNLYLARFYRTDFHGANLAHACIDGALLSDCRPSIYELDMVDPRGYRPIAVMHDSGWRIKSGCRWFTVAEAVDHWGRSDHRESADRYLRAIRDMMA